MEKEHYIKRFKIARDAISKKTGITFLRLDPARDDSLHPREIDITDPQTDKTVASFLIEGELDKKKIDIYFFKLHSILLRLAEEMKNRQRHIEKNFKG